MALDVSRLLIINCCPNSETGLPEWGIVELQGDLEVRENQIMSGQFVGDLNYNKYGQPILIIGHHILHGKEQKLDKPFAVLEKITSKQTNRVNDSINTTLLDSSQLNNTTINKTLLDSTIAIENKTKQKTDYMVKAIVKKKLVFKTRPKPIIANFAKQI